MNLFDPKDYQSISLQVKVKNLTSGIDVGVNTARSGGNGHDDGEGDNAEAGASEGGIRLIEFQDKGIAVFGFPKNSCAVGHSLDITLAIKSYKKKYKMSLTAKVLSIINDQDVFSLVTTHFVQYVQEDWEKFLEIYSNRQQEISKFFLSVKGES